MTLSYIAHSIFRFIQLILALTVCGLYGVDLSAAHKQHKYSDGKWVRLPSFSPPRPPKKSNNPTPGLRRNHRLPLGHHSPPLPRPPHLAHRPALHLGHDPVHPVDRAVRAVRQHVYPRARRGRRGRAAYEECGLGGSGECAVVAV